MAEEVKEAGIPNIPFKEMTKEQLLNVVTNLVSQNRQLQIACKQLQAGYNQLNDNVSTLDIMFRVLENKDAFPKEFVDEMAEAIKNTIVKVDNEVNSEEKESTE